MDSALLFLTLVSAVLGLALTVASIISPKTKHDDGRLTRAGNAFLVVAIVSSVTTAASGQLQDRKAEAERVLADSLAQERSKAVTQRLEHVIAQTEAVRNESDRLRELQRFALMGVDSLAMASAELTVQQRQALRDLETGLGLTQRLLDSTRHANARADARAEETWARIYRAQNPLSSLRGRFALLLTGRDPEVIQLISQIAAEQGSEGPRPLEYVTQVNGRSARILLPEVLGLDFWSENGACGSDKRTPNPILQGHVPLNYDSAQFRHSRRGSEFFLIIEWPESDILFSTHQNLTVDEIRNLCMQITPSRPSAEWNDAQDSAWNSVVIRTELQFPQGRSLWGDIFSQQIDGEIRWIRRIPQDL